MLSDFVTQWSLFERDHMHASRGVSFAFEYQIRGVSMILSTHDQIVRVAFGDTWT